MPSAYLRSRLEERAQLTDLVTGVLDKAAAANRDVTDDEQKLLDGWEKRSAVLDTEIEHLTTQEEAHQKFQQTLGRHAQLKEREERGGARERQQREPEERKSFGEQFIASEEFQRYRGRGSMDPVEFEHFLETRAAIVTADLDIQPYRWDGPAQPAFSSPLLNVIGREVVTSGSVEYVLTTSTSDAEEVDETALKPEATIGFMPNTVNLLTYAHWKALSRQALEDAPRIQSIVENGLRRGLTQKLEAVAADVINAAAFPAVAATDLSTGIRLGVGTVQEAGYQPNAVLLNPSDYANLDIDTAAGANNGPTGYTTYWGVRPIPVPEIAAGTSFVGDFKEAVTWFDRAKTAVYMTDSHADYFIRNLLVVLAETRAAFAETALDAAAKITVAAQQVAKSTK